MFADVTQQGIFISSHQEEPGVHTHLIVQITALTCDGPLKDQELELQVSRNQDVDINKKYSRILFQSKPCLMYCI